MEVANSRPELGLLERHLMLRGKGQGWQVREEVAEWMSYPECQSLDCRTLTIQQSFLCLGVL